MVHNISDRPIRKLNVVSGEAARALTVGTKPLILVPGNARFAGASAATRLHNMLSARRWRLAEAARYPGAAAAAKATRADDIIDLGAPRSPRRSRRPYTPNPRLYPGPAAPRKGRRRVRGRGRKQVFRRPVPNSRLYRPGPPRAPPPPAVPPRPWAPPPPERALDTASRAALRLAQERGSPPAAHSPSPPARGHPAARRGARRLVVKLPTQSNSPVRRTPFDMADDGSDSTEAQGAPSEFLAEFLSAIMQRQYAEALKYCQLILQYEPHNATARGFHQLLRHKLAQLARGQRSRSPSPSPGSPRASPGASPAGSASPASPASSSASPSPRSLRSDTSTDSGAGGAGAGAGAGAPRRVPSTSESDGSSDGGWPAGAARPSASSDSGGSATRWARGRPTAAEALPPAATDRNGNPARDLNDNAPSQRPPTRSAKPAAARAAPPAPAAPAAPAPAAPTLSRSLATLRAAFAQPAPSRPKVS